jgi:hypothetical protein
MRTIVKILVFVWCLGAPVVMFTMGINFERDAAPVCYALQEDSRLEGCEFVREHKSDRYGRWVRKPVSVDDLLSGYRR